MGFETGAGSPRFETATVPKLTLGCSGRKSAGEKNFRRGDGGQVSIFTASLKCGARVDSGLEWSQPDAMAIETMFWADSLCRAVQDGE